METKIETKRPPSIRVADEVWIATALLHRQHPDREDFTIQEIVDQAREVNLFGNLRPGVRVHATTQCVANRPPSPGGYIMLFATGKRTRRLFRPGDPVHPQRNGKVMPNREDIPPEYHELLDWYETKYAQGLATKRHPLDALLALEGSGREIWKDEHADEYVRRLREGWE